MTAESGLVSINNKSLLFLPSFLSLPLRLLRTLASALGKKTFTRNVSHETKIKSITINSLLNADYDKIVGYSTLPPLRQMKPVNRKRSKRHSREFIPD